MPTVDIASPTVVRHGAELTFETLGEDYAPLRVHRSEDTLLRVIDGCIRLVVDGVERLLGTGGEAIVPAGAAHRIASARGHARIMLGFRAA
jgi:mannose-6-phosphate isomerase-like protein (cupin superfamily)